MKFCDNPECIASIEVRYELRELELELPTGQRKNLRRHKYYKKKLRGFFYFCDICHNAIQMQKVG